MTTDRECLQSVQAQLGSIQNQIAAQLGSEPVPPDPGPPTDPTSPHGYPVHGSLIGGVSGQGGTQVPHNGPANYAYTIPDVIAGTTLEVTCASGYQSTTLRVYDPASQLAKNKYGLPAEGTFISGAGSVMAVAPVAGTYLLEVEGGDGPTTINHQRHLP